jgi:chromosome segregation ATPase
MGQGAPALQKTVKESNSKRIDSVQAAEKLLVPKESVSEWLRKGLLKGTSGDIQLYELEKFRAKYPGEISKAQQQRSDTRNLIPQPENQQSAKSVPQQLHKPEQQKKVDARAKSPGLLQRLGGLLTGIFKKKPSKRLEKETHSAPTEKPRAKSGSQDAPHDSGKQQRPDRIDVADYEARFQEPAEKAPIAAPVPVPSTETETRLLKAQDLLELDIDRSNSRPNSPPASHQAGHTLVGNLGDIFRGGKAEISALSDMGIRLEKLERTCSELSQRAEVAEQANTRYLREIADWKSEVSVLRESELRLQSQLTSLGSGGGSRHQDEHPALRSELESLKSNFSQAQQHIQSQQSRILEFQKQMQKAETVLRQRDLEIAQLNQEISSLQSRYQSQERLLGQTGNTGGDSSKLLELTRMLEESRNQLNGKTYEYELLKSQHVLFEQDHAKIVAALEQDVARLTSAASGRPVVTDGDSKAWQSRVSEVQKRNSELESYYSQQKQRWEKELNSASGWVAKLSDSVKERDRRIQELQAQISAPNANQSAQDSLRNAQARLQQAAIEVQKRDREIEQLRARLASESGERASQSSGSVSAGPTSRQPRLQIHPPPSPDFDSNTSDQPGDRGTKRLGLNLNRPRINPELNSPPGSAPGSLGNPIPREET